MNNYNYLDDLFLLRFPNGLEDEMFLKLSKKHNTSKSILNEFKALDIESFLLNDSYHNNKNVLAIIKMISKSSMVSVFEKVAFKNYLADNKIHDIFLQSLYYFLKDTNHKTFNDFVSVLNIKKVELNKKVATWPIVTFFLIYYNEKSEVFIKPTTIKKLARLLEYPLKYDSIPNYETYNQVKEMVLKYKNDSHLVDENSSNLLVQAIMYSGLEL